MGMDRQGQRGVSLLEVVITLALLTVAMAAFYEVMIGASRAGMFTESRNDLAVIGERAVNTIHTEIGQSRLAFQNDAIGNGYRTLFVNGLPLGTTVWTNSRLPIFDANNATFGPDPGPSAIANRTGNCLLVARQLAPVSIPYDHDGDAGTAEVNFLADRYQFQFYFLRANPSRSFGSLGYYLDLVQAKSQIVADFVQLNGVTTNRAQLLTRLNAATAIAWAWDPGRAVTAPAFYTLTGGALAATTPTAFTVTTKSLCAEFAGGRISGAMEYSVCLNASTPMVVKDAVPMYATPNANFPGGLEFQIVGASGERKVMTRLVTAAWYSKQFNSQQASVVTFAHGF